MANSALHEAKKAKADEFYTSWVDIEREMNAYLEYDPDVFRGKTILLPCDDPEWSNFTKYFALHFQDFGIKKLISTSYAPESNARGAFYAPTLFETEDPGYNVDLSMKRGRVFTLVSEDVTGDGRVDFDDLQWEYLNGDGDFRSPEVTGLLAEADMVITNPPFSLFRPFLTWLVEGGVKFSIIGNMNAMTYREVFPLIRDNKLWLGPTISSGDREFRVPDSYPLNAAGFRVDDDGKKYIRVKGVRWFTNIDHGRRHQPLQLMTMADNIKFSKHNEVRGVGYEHYDNFDAMEVGFTDAIPSDYRGLMGVPITFLDKYNPDQFEIVGSSEGDYPAKKKYSKKERVVDGVRKKSNTGTLSGAIRTESFGPGTHFDVGYPVKSVYKRIFIRHLNSASEES